MSGWPEERAGRKVCAGSPAAGANAGGHIDGCAHAYGGGVVGWFGTNAGGCVGGYAYAYGGGVVR